MQNAQDSDRATTRSPGHWSSFVRPRIIRSLITHNPLYLVSACFVLHGTSQLLPKSLDQSSAYNPWPRLGLSCGYLFLLALTAVAIVRWGKVWEDARSILLIIAVMFVELSLALDAALMQNPTTGRWLVVLGFITALLVTEFLIRGLAIRVPGLFRPPLHLMLALVFLYPLLLARAPGQPSVLNAPWGVYLFSPLTAAVFLALLPAIRRGREYVRDNRSPWSWDSSSAIGSRDGCAGQEQFSCS